MVKKLPAQVLVRWDVDSDEPYLIANERLIDHAEIGQKRKVGIYKLVEVRDVEGVASHKLAKQ